MVKYWIHRNPYVHSGDPKNEGKKKKLICIIGSDYSRNFYSKISSKREITEHLPCFSSRNFTYHSNRLGKTHL